MPVITPEQNNANGSLHTGLHCQVVYTRGVMKRINITCLLTCTLSIFANICIANGDDSLDLIDRLRQTMAINIEDVINAQFPGAAPVKGFSVVNPYTPQASESVQQRKTLAWRETQVCAIRFTDTLRVAYELRGFETSALATSAGFIVTHHGSCGSCSTLHDLSVYLGTPDLTTPARECARRFGLSRKQQCFEKIVGFTSYCAESWAYNARNTKQACLGTCVSDYGLLNLLFHRYPGTAVTQSGQLRPCLQCDEDKSGPGFEYSAGRTRRNSGIESAIPRPEAEISSVDHTRYFHE